MAFSLSAKSVAFFVLIATCVVVTMDGLLISGLLVFLVFQPAMAILSALSNSFRQFWGW